MHWRTHSGPPPATPQFRLPAALSIYLLMALCTIGRPVSAQEVALPVPPPGYRIIAPAVQPEVTAGQLLLIDLETKFQEATRLGGGKAFSEWFAPDAVVLNNGQPAVVGHTAIAESATWDPKTYQLTWIPEGAQMGPSGDMGFTWGRYEGRSLDPQGKTLSVKTGRYFTVWKKLPDASWKVAMDGGADEPPASKSACCTVPGPSSIEATPARPETP